MNWIAQLVDKWSKDMPSFAPMKYEITDEGGIISSFLIDQEDPLEGRDDFKRMKSFIRGWSPCCRVEVSQDGEILEVATIEDIFS